ncbi:hypothetical protein R1flu_003002 [Riccia fluitans]|uniref:Uncharacterized protein n=1 Tax=Riccia fluitans TaxID=41844 RepID=A0ABD1Y7R0_9MARC
MDSSSKEFNEYDRVAIVFWQDEWDQMTQQKTIRCSIRGTAKPMPLFARGAAGPQDQLPIAVSREGLKEYLVFPGSEDSSRVVSASVIEAEFLCHIGHKSLKDAWTTISLRLNHKNEDRASIVKFREDWQVVVQLLHTKFLTRMPRQNQEGPLLLGDEPGSAFGDTQAQWDTERCELVRERDQLKEDLLKAQDAFAQREEALQIEHKRLQEEYS